MSTPSCWNWYTTQSRADHSEKEKLQENLKVLSEYEKDNWESKASSRDNYQIYMWYTENSRSGHLEDALLENQLSTAMGGLILSTPEIGHTST